LYSIISKMDFWILQVLIIIFVAAGPYVAFFVKVAAEMDVLYYLREAEYADVKLSHWWAEPVYAAD